MSESLGLAAPYPGDRGVARDPDVLFAEDLEADSLGTVVKRWDAASNID